MQQQRLLRAARRAAEREPHLVLIDGLELGLRERRPGGVAHELGATVAVVGADPHAGVDLKVTAGLLRLYTDDPGRLTRRR